MANKEIDTYITKRYNRWMDYSKFQTTRAGIPEEATDLLNEVLLSLLKKDENYLLNLLHSKKGPYCELDFYTLKLVKMNATSITAPYLAKHKPIPTDRNVDFTLLNILDEKEPEIDKPKEFLNNYQTVCKIVDRLDLNKIEKEVFNHVFVMQEPISNHNKCDNLRKQLYDSYLTIKAALSLILFQEGIIQVYPTKTITKRAKNLVDQYNLTKVY